MSDWEKGYSQPADITSRWFHDYVYYEGGPGGGALRVTMDNPLAIDVVYTSGEVMDIVTPDYKGFLVGGYVYTTGAYQAFNFDDMGRLRVDAEISIQATELDVNIDALDGDSVILFGHEDGFTGNTPIPINITGDGAVRVVQSFAGAETLLYNELSVPAATETQVISYTVAVATDFHALTIMCSGEADGDFILKKNGAVRAKKRNSWADRNVDFQFPFSFKLQAGDVISVHVLHNNDNACLFNASIYGESDSV